MPVREFQAEDLEAAYALDQICYPPGIACSRFALREFLALPRVRAEQLPLKTFARLYQELSPVERIQRRPNSRL